ncbi:hypothetical protein GCM10023228_03670 [Brevibacillus fulvus]
MCLFVVVLLTGCQPTSRPGTTSYSDPNYYYQQSVVRPDGSEPNVTPYGPPVNSGTSTDYDRPLRRDAISDYSRIWPTTVPKRTKP